MKSIKQRILFRRFQFLIGRLGTARGRGERGLEVVFQFLIGRLGTTQNWGKNTARQKFQFLIGRLGTRFCSRSGASHVGFNSS